MGGVQIEMEQGLAVAMQVKDEIGIMGKACQRQALAGKLRCCRHLRQALPDGPAHRGDVRRRIAAELPAHPVGQPLEQIGPAAVEIAASAGVVTPGKGGIHHLAAADGIGDRHDDDLALDRADLIGLVQQADQVMLDQHRRNLVGMEGGLQIGLGPRAGFAVAVQDQMTGAAQAGCAQVDAFD
jgi:hypothetical protein